MFWNFAEPDTCHLQMNFFFGRVVNDDETVATAEKRSRAAPTFPDLSRFTVSTLAKRQRENEKGWQSIAFGHECPCRRVPRRRLRVGGPLDVVVPAADSGGALRHESIGGGTSNDPIGTSGGAIRWAHLA